jgi:GNAT superfamily N-acetyltransferase
MDVRELTAADLPKVDSRLPLHRLDNFQTYLIAWDGDEPIGHAHVAWEGTTLGVPEIQDVFVLPERRRDGVGTRLSQAAERLTRDRGRDRISISAGEANEGALRLYRRLGYRNADIPPQRVVETIAIRGRRVDIDDTLIYLVKDLPTVQR